MSKPFTVIGYWDGDRPVSVGVIEGEHGVHAGHGYTEEGDWVTSVEADTPEEAEALAVEMGESNEEDLDDDDDDEGDQL
jgi:hypothetical protein